MKDDLKPIWWCARVGEDIIGVTAAWKEKDKWHWGRFAVDKRLRGIGIGQKIAVFSLKEIFNSYTEEIYIEARDITFTTKADTLKQTINGIVWNVNDNLGIFLDYMTADNIIDKNNISSSTSGCIGIMFRCSYFKWIIRTF